jgi:riboflavin biosynthesis pyrimidine reductase
LQPSDFSAFERRKVRAALAAELQPFVTTRDLSTSFDLEPLSTAFTARLLDGPFLQSPAAGALPAINLVFVRSRDGNTVADDPSSLGGGETDKHVIYEGLSRVAADAVLAGSRTVGDGDLLFSVWHPEIVKLRARLGKPRHPAQMIVTGRGALPIETGLIFNVPEVPVIILTGADQASALADRTRSRPWITVVPSADAPDLPSQLAHVRREMGIERISAVGGPRLATALLDEGLVRDLYLTTAAREGGEPGTPFYTGGNMPTRRLVVRKEGTGVDAGVIFEHAAMAGVLILRTSLR